MISFRQRLFIKAFNIATALLMAWYVVEFISKERWRVPNTLAEIFLLILVFYAGDKELHRWHHRHKGSNRHGELFVLAWVVLGATMYVIESIGGKTFGFSKGYSAGHLERHHHLHHHRVPEIGVSQEVTYPNDQ